MSRPSVDVVVPFRGEATERADLVNRLTKLALREEDSVILVDNTPGALSQPGPVQVVAASARLTPGYARNRGAELGEADWIVFLDADVVAPPNLVDQYFLVPPEPRSAILAGGVRDQPVDTQGPPAARYAHLRELMSQENTLSWGEWAFAQTANAACRRQAFQEVGGFREDIRAAEDADLAYRLRASGWGMERRGEASVVHISRTAVRDLVRQRIVHGSGGAWLDRHYPGSCPKKRWPGFSWWIVRSMTLGLASATRDRDRDRAVMAILEPLDNLVYEIGRSLDNRRPRARRGPSER